MYALVVPPQVQLQSALLGATSAAATSQSPLIAGMLNVPPVFPIEMFEEPSILTNPWKSPHAQGIHPLMIVLKLNFIY